MTRARDVANVLSTASILATDTETAAAISAHNSGTTSVHGISNTALLATQEYVQNNKGVGKGNTASRPASPSIGDLYYNTELKDLEQYTEDGWMIVAKQPPRIPTIGSATLDGSNNASVSFTPSAYGQTASSFTVQSNPGSYTSTASSSPVSLSGTNLEVGTAYTFRVKSTGSYGESAYSGYTSSAVTRVNLSDYESISTVTVGSGGSASITFSSIPATYTHLQIRGITRSTRAITQTAFRVRFNSDSGSNYSYHGLYGDGSSAQVDAGASTTYIQLPRFSGASATADLFGAGVIDILDYANTNKNKTLRALAGVDRNGAGDIWFNSGAWYNTNAITSITLTEASTGDFAEYSQWALYGVKS